MSKNAKRFAALLLVAALLICLAAASVFVLKRFSDMYWNLYGAVHDRADHIISYVDGMHQVPYAFDYSWVDGSPSSPLIAHAFGGIDGVVYTNSLEAFEANYALGHRCFEVDFDLMPDEYRMIASHNEETWREVTGAGEEIPYDLENVLHPSFENPFTMLDYRDVVDLMAQYSDIHIITDTKRYDSVNTFLQFSQLVKYANETAPEVLERIVPQIYTESMLNWVMSVYPFKSVIYTLYLSGQEPESVYDFCLRSGVRFVALYGTYPIAEAIDLWEPLDIITAVYTVNDPAQASEYLDMGVDMIYTDFLNPGSLNRP